MTDLTAEANPVRSYALPLVVAVTGHRDLLSGEIDRIKQYVRQFLEDLRDRYPAHRITVMSPLAEGADLLAAEVALELGLDLVVPLPKARADYLKDFKSDASRQQFESLCSQASEVFELANDRPPVPEGIDQSVWENDFPFAQLGTFLSAHCHILLAIWDGKPSNQLGGTGQVVRFHQDDVMPGITPQTSATLQMLVDDESDLVFHIECARETEAVRTSAGYLAPSGYWYSKDPKRPRSSQLPQQHALIFQRSAEFSADAQAHASKIAAEKCSLINPQLNLELYPGIEHIDHYFCMADWLAIYFQKKALRTLRITHTLAFLMGLVFILYSDLEAWRYFLFGFLVFFGGAVAANYLAKRGEWHRKYLDYRTLAEGLRVQFYWAVAGITSRHTWKFAHDAYLQGQNPEFGWIRNVMRVAGTLSDAAPGKPGTGLEFVLREWVGDKEHGQLGYFMKKAQERIRRNKLTEGLGRLSLVISVAIVCVFLLLGARLSDTTSAVLTVAMGAAMLLFAIREGYAYATAIKELIKQYEYMLRIYDNAHRRLSQAGSLEEKQQILAVLGQSALDEHADWILMHRERSLDESEIWRMGS